MENLSACADAVTAWYIRNDLLLNPNKTEALDAGMRQQFAKFDTSRGVGFRHDYTISPHSSVRATTTPARSDTSATSSTKILQTGSLVPSYALGWTIAMLFCTVSPSSISAGSIESRTHWHVLSVLHHIWLPALVYGDPYTGFQLRNASPTKLQRWLSRLDFTTNRFTLVNYSSTTYRQGHFAPRTKYSSSNPEPRLWQYPGAFRVAGSHIWNALPLGIRSAPSIRSFRDRLKTFLFNKAYNS